MIILAVDLTSEFGSVAVGADGRISAELPLHSPQGFAHLIFPAIEEVLRRSQIRLEQIDCFASAAGPGAFTGVRVGLSAVKGLAEAMGKAAVGVSNLRAMATFGTGENRAVVLDARRGEVFGGVYDSGLELVSPEVVMKFPAWLDTLHESHYEFVVQPGFNLQQQLRGTRFESMPLIEAPRSLASGIAMCAEIDGRGGKWLDPAALDANYVRRSDAELFWKEG